MKKLIVAIAALTLITGCPGKKPPADPDVNIEAPGHEGDTNVIDRYPMAVTADIKVLSAEFGTFGEEINGKREFTLTDNVPFAIDQRYGWIIALETTKEKVKLREVFTLPDVPEQWLNVEDTQLSGDESVFDTTEEVNVINGRVSDTWRMVKGDPVGEHKIEVYIEDILVATFVFQVGE